MTAAIERICNLPRDFRAGDKSELRLVDESGIRQQLEQFNEPAIIEILRRDPGLVEDWLTYSADKRTSGGWYFTEDGPNQYLVGTIDGERVHFEDPTIACASFIIRELDRMAREPR